MKIKDLPKVDRPREKLIRYGVKKLSNSELLAIILGKGKKGENVLKLAQKVLKNFPNNKLSDTNIDQLVKISGIGSTKACQLVACFELGRRLLKKKENISVISPKQIWEELRDIRSHKKEHFIAFYLDTRNDLIHKEIISIGTLNSSLVHPRELFEPAIKYLSAQLIIAHNHPSGDSSPSDDDLVLTKRLVEAGKILGIEVLDHVIVTSDSFFSFKEKNLI